MYTMGFYRLSSTKCACYDQSERAHYISIIYTQALHQLRGVYMVPASNFCTFLSSIQVPLRALYLFRTYHQKNVMLAQIQL